MQVNLTLRMFEGCHTSVAGTQSLRTSPALTTSHMSFLERFQQNMRNAHSHVHSGWGS